jgi:outer membrane protein assembly factor BamA
VRLQISLYIIWLGVISCGGKSAPAPTHAPVAVPCSPARVGQVAVVGAPKPSVPALAVLEGTIDDSLRTDRVIAGALEALRFRGYAHATIGVTRRVGCFTDLTVTVALGPRFKIDRIDFQTTDEFPARERLAVIEDALGTVNTIGGVYIEYRLQRALAVLERRYQDAGWLEAKITPPAARFDSGGNVVLTIPIAAGPRFRIAAIRARGAGAAARAAELEEIHVEPGAWYDGAAIRSGIERARRRLDRSVELRTSVSADRSEIELEAVLETAR